MLFSFIFNYIYKTSRVAKLYLTFLILFILIFILYQYKFIYLKK